MFELRVGTIVMHQGEKKRIIEKIKSYDKFVLPNFIYKLEDLKTGSITQDFLENLEMTKKTKNKFDVGNVVRINYGEHKGKDTEVLKVSIGIDDFEYELSINGEKLPIKIREDFLESLKCNDFIVNYKVNDTVKCHKNGRIGTVVNTSKAVRNRYKLEFYDGYAMWVYGYDMSLIGSEETAKDDKVELSKEDYFSILALAVDLGDKDLLDTYKEKVNNI